MLRRVSALALSAALLILPTAAFSVNVERLAAATSCCDSMGQQCGGASPSACCGVSTVHLEAVMSAASAPLHSVSFDTIAFGPSEIPLTLVANGPATPSESGSPPVLHRTPTVLRI